MKKIIYVLNKVKQSNIPNAVTRVATVTAYYQLRTGGLVDWAQHELELAGLFDKDSVYGGMLGSSILKLVKEFSKEGHSGCSAGISIDIINKLLKYQPLTPLGNPTETGEYIICTYGDNRNPPVWQSTRDYSVFSEDSGKTWYKNVDDTYEEQLGEDHNVSREDPDYGKWVSFNKIRRVPLDKIDTDEGKPIDYRSHNGV
jgi:hypothetical protein